MADRAAKLQKKAPDSVFIGTRVRVFSNIRRYLDLFLKPTPYLNKTKGASGDTNNHNQSTTLSKLFNAQWHVFNFISYFLLFGCGLSVGVILSFHLKSISMDLHTQFSLTSRSSPPSLAMAPPQPSESPVETKSDNGGQYGLKDFLEPPEAMHGMDDAQLLWRASMTPRIAQYPVNRIPKVAFLFLTKGSVSLAPLWEKFFKGYKGMYSIYIHSNPPFNLSEAEREGSVFYGRRIPSKVSPLNLPSHFFFLIFSHVFLIDDAASKMGTCKHVRSGASASSQCVDGFLKPKICSSVRSMHSTV